MQNKDIIHFFKSLLSEDTDGEKVSCITFEVTKEKQIVHYYDADKDILETVDISNNEYERKIFH